MPTLKCFAVLCYENETVSKAAATGIHSLIRKLNFTFMFHIHCIYFAVIWYNVSDVCFGYFQQHTMENPFQTYCYVFSRGTNPQKCKWPLLSVWLTFVEVGPFLPIVLPFRTRYDPTQFVERGFFNLFTGNFHTYKAKNSPSSTIIDLWIKILEQ